MTPPPPINASHADDEGDLHTRWSALWHRLGVPPDRAPAIDPLLKAYNDPARAYHNLRHIGQCLDELDGLRDFCDSPDAVETAIWFHDAVYDSTRADNEARSASLATDALQAASIAPATIHEVESLILATQHAHPPQTTDERILVDIDLSILGQPPAVFDAYERDIRREYAHVPDEAFRTGRAAILRRFLARPALFATPPMQARYESPARQNLHRSLLNLEQH